MTAKRLEAATDLARKHYEIEEGMSQIVLYSAGDTANGSEVEPLKLLEVNANTIPSGVMPLHFGAAPEHGFVYPSVIIEVTPDEYRNIQEKKLVLPVGWDIPCPLPKSPVNTEAV